MGSKYASSDPFVTVSRAGLTGPAPGEAAARSRTSSDRGAGASTASEALVEKFAIKSHAAISPRNG
jgi:hypothetical protein